MIPSKNKPLFFPKQSDFRDWLEKNHREASELWVAYYKKVTKKPSITWPQSVEEALCFGWIDGLRKSIDDESYIIRFTPRRPNSHWSTINIKRVEELKKLHLMKPTGLEVFKKRKEEKSSRASYEQKSVKLDPSYQSKLKANQKAWQFFQALPPSVQKPCIWWIISAKKEETQLRRLNMLIDSSEKGEKIPPLKWTKKTGNE